MQVRLSTYLRSFAVQDPGNWSHMVDFAQAADEAGIDRLVLSDHVVFGENLSAYGDPAIGGTRDGKQPTGPDGAWLDPLTAIAYLTAFTSQIRSSRRTFLLAALRRPVVLAKVAATIDVLSGGRLDMGVGVGWQREEYEAAGLPFEERGRLLNQTIEVCQTLWRNESATYSSEELSFADIHQMPKPIQPGGILIWVSGTVNRRSMDRLARYGSGWIPWGDDAVDLEAGIGQMRRAMAERGRDPSELGVVGALSLVKDEHGNFDLGQTMTLCRDLLNSG